MIKRIVIAGSRHFQDYDFFCANVDTCLSKIRKEYTVVLLSGHCSGIDTMAERYAKEHGLQLEIFPAEWDKYGKGAGPKRNKQMVDAADYAITFPSGGNGTKSLIALARKKGIPITVIPVDV